MLEVELTISTQESQRLLEQAREHSPGGVQGAGRWSRPFPIFFKKALGARMWDVDDNEYVDYHGSHSGALGRRWLYMAWG